MERRSFLIGSLGLAFARASSAIAGPPISNGCIVSPYSHSEGKKLVHGVMILDLDRRKMTTIPTPFAIHIVSAGVEKSGLCYGVASYSNHVAKIDLRSAKVLLVKELSPKFEYSGHSTVSKSGHIYATVSEKSAAKDSDPLRTGLVRLDPVTMNLDEEYLFPKLDGLGTLHDVQTFSSDGNILVSAGGSLLIHINLKTKTIVRSDKIEFDIARASLNHFAFSSEGNFGLQSRVSDSGAGNGGISKLGAPVLFDSGNRKFRILRQTGELSKRLNRDLFGLCLNREGSVLGIANLWDDFLSFWNMQSGKLLKSFDLRQPTGITLSADGKYFLVTTTSGLMYFDSQTLKQVFGLTDFKKEFGELFGQTISKGRLFHSTAIFLS
ncbi:MAG: hypothetical protein J0L82_09840 [Deltaproteobacteria bacterium]|jgi:hypothetical protein|nr:hypothetical protein [Deltaproteobacteria bacterium]